MLKNLFVEHRLNIEYFFDSINMSAVESMFELALNCKGMLIFSGVGKSGIIAEKLATTMISTGTKAIYIPPTNALHGDIGIVGKDDIVILVSKSGQTEELISLVPVIKSRGAKIALWACEIGSKLEKLCDSTVYLPVKRELCPFDLAPTTSTAVQLILGDILAVALMKEKSFSLDQYALNHPAGSIGKKATLRVGDIMVTGDRLPVCRSDDELRDVLIELTNKRLGCLLVTDNNSRLVGIFTDGDLRRAIQQNDGGLLEERVATLMNPSFISIQKEALAIEALRVMQGDKWIMHLPVLENERLVGLVHMHDIVHTGIR